MTAAVAAAGVLLFAVMACAWLVERRTRNVGWVDVFWTFGVGAAGAGLALYCVHGQPLRPRQVLTGTLAGLWALRLGLHVALRVAGAPEDRRYVALRKAWAAGFQAKLLGFILLQAPVGLVLAWAIMLAARNPEPLGLKDAAGAALLAIAIVGEGVADEQLRRFRADPASHGRLCDRGLWAWSRHPNYFFEWLGWLAYPVIAWAPAHVYVWGWAAWIAPVLMFLVLDRGTGVPPLEAHMAESRGAAFADYRARVSRFFPAPPRKHPS